MDSRLLIVTQRGFGHKELNFDLCVLVLPPRSASLLTSHLLLISASSILHPDIAMKSIIVLSALAAAAVAAIATIIYYPDLRHFGEGMIFRYMNAPVATANKVCQS